MESHTERDDFIYALTQVMHFYGKELDKMQVSFWVTACKSRPIGKLKAALKQHIEVGKYAPKPADILSLIDQMPAERQTALPAPLVTECPPDIARAWQWFIGRIAKGSSLELLFDEQSEVDVATQERYLHVVNHEAHKYGTPEAIPEEFRIQEVWG